jgi:hypothetical protein
MLSKKCIFDSIGHKESYSTASTYDRCTFDCGRSRKAETRRPGRATVMPMIAGLCPNNDALHDLPPPPQYWRCSWTARRSPSRSGTSADETVHFSMSGAIPACDVLSGESRAQACVLVVILLRTVFEVKGCQTMETQQQAQAFEPGIDGRAVADRVLHGRLQCRWTAAASANGNLSPLSPRVP